MKPSVDVSAERRGHPSVTVVIPTVNRPEMLDRAVSAVLAQDYLGAVECLVVFDHVEPTLESQQMSPTRKVVVARNTHDRGLAGNRNTGYLLATGELLAGCDDDDEWLPGKLTAQVRLLQEHPEASVVSCGILVHFRGRDIPRIPSAEMHLEDFLKHRHFEVFPSSNLMRRRDVLDTIGLVDERIPGSYGEDYEWIFRATRLGPVICDPRPLVRVYWHESSTFVGDWRTNIAALTYLIERVPEFQGTRGLGRLEGQIAFAHAALNERKLAFRLSWRALVKNPKARQAWAALLVTSRMMSAPRVLAYTRRFGHGI
jgi:glycosyltransferase involved in cell wall biosynthesis